MRSLFRALLSVCLLASMGLGTGTAHAEVDWCGSDPPVHLVLPSGRPLEVTVWVEVPRSQRAALNAMSVSGDVVRVRGNTADIQVTVTVPEGDSGGFPVRASVSSHGSSNDVNSNGNTNGGSQSGGSVTLVIPLSVTLPPGLA